MNPNLGLAEFQISQIEMFDLPILVVDLALNQTQSQNHFHYHLASWLRDGNLCHMNRLVRVGPVMAHGLVVNVDMCVFHTFLDYYKTLNRLRYR